MKHIPCNVYQPASFTAQNISSACSFSFNLALFYLPFIFLLPGIIQLPHVLSCRRLHPLLHQPYRTFSSDPSPCPIYTTFDLISLHSTLLSRIQSIHLYYDHSDSSTVFVFNDLPSVLISLGIHVLIHYNNLSSTNYFSLISLKTRVPPTSPFSNELASHIF